MFVPLTVSDFLDRAAYVFGGRVAVVDEASVPGSLGQMTYREVQQRALGLAGALDDLDVPVGGRVAIVSPNAARFLIAFFGVSGSGRALVPVNFRLTASEVEYVVDHSGAEVLLVDPEYDEPLRQVVARERIVMDGVADAGLFAPIADGRSPKRWDPDENATCSINYTSGTTARPKGVRAHASQLLDQRHDVRLAHDGHRPRRPAAHAADVPLQRVGHAVCGHRDGRDARRAPQGGRRGDPAARRSRRGDADVRRPGGRRRDPRRGGAAPLPWRARARAGDRTRRRRRRPPPTASSNGSRPSSAGSSSRSTASPRRPRCSRSIARRPNGTASSLDDRARLISRAGTPAIGVSLRIDENDEVCARANQVFAGYWNQPEETAKVLVDGWFHTGDGGYMDGPYLVISDRKKDVIISGGENVSSIEVEDVLYGHPAVAEAAVIGVPDDKWGETVMALVVLRPDGERDRTRDDRVLQSQDGALQVPDEN